MGNRLKKNVPVLRFPEFEGYPELKYLGEILDFKNGINADKSQYGQGVKFINVLDIINDAPIYYDSIIGCVDISDQEFQKNNVQYGDVLFQRSSEIREESGQSNIYLDKNQDATFGGFVIRGRPKVKFNPIYFNYLLKTGSVRKEVTDRSGGSTRFNIGQDSLSQVPILICNSIAEQEKIASFLGAIDTRITQLRRKHELLQTYKRGVMQKLFSQQIRFKCDDGKPFPDWEKKKLGEIASRQVKKNLDESITRVLTNSAVQGVVDQQDYFDKDIANANNLGGYYIIEKGDYVYNPRISTNAPVGPIHKNKIGLGVMSPLYTVFRFKTKEDAFYEQLFKTSVWHKYMCSVANYGARYDRMNITTSDFMALPLPYPISEEQKKITTFLTAIDKKIEAVAKQIDLTEQFKKGLLQKMFV
ncbi:MAG: restriction endonuclease subunit S [Microcoleus sp.]